MTSPFFEAAPPPPTPQSVPNNTAAAPTSSQTTASNCVFAVQCPSLFDTDADNSVDSLKSVDSSDVLSTDIDNNDFSQTTTAAMHETTTILLKTAKLSQFPLIRNLWLEYFLMKVHNAVKFARHLQLS